MSPILSTLNATAGLIAFRTAMKVAATVAVNATHLLHDGGRRTVIAVIIVGVLKRDVLFGDSAIERRIVHPRVVQTRIICRILKVFGSWGY